MAYTVCATWVAREGEEDAVAAALEHIYAAALQEDYVLAYVFHRDPGDPRRFFFYEQYTDADAYQSHLQAPYVLEHGFRYAIPRLESRERVFWETWEPAKPGA
jgi:quinol monooxygenase YgiN